MFESAVRATAVARVFTFRVFTDDYPVEVAWSAVAER